MLRPWPSSYRHPPDVRSLVHEFRGLQVMLDSDLAALYGVSTGRLMEQVPRPRRRVGFG